MLQFFWRATCIDRLTDEAAVVRARFVLQNLRHGLLAARRELVVVRPVARGRPGVHDVVTVLAARGTLGRLRVVLATQRVHSMSLQ